MTTNQSASLAVYGEVKRGHCDMEPQAPLTCGGDAPSARSEFFTKLHLHQATGFFARLLGVWHQPLQEGDAQDPHTGLWLNPCRGIHTLALSVPLDIVFLNHTHRIVRIVPKLLPNRMAFCWQAHSVIELPGGWCHRHPDYATAIARAVAHTVR